MSEFELIQRERPASTSIFFILMTVLVGFYVIGPSIGLMLALPLLDIPLSTFSEYVKDPLAHPEIKMALIIVQGAASFFGLVVGPALYWFAVERKNVLDLVRKQSISGSALILTAVAIIMFMIPNSFFVDWNAHVEFPEFMNDFGNWAKTTEDYAETLTKFLTHFDSPVEFIIVFLLIAVLPGIGEELVFRGMLQPKLQKATNNVHAAIWISAILFSLMHLQFFGFIPRVFLGAFFGYLYVWSGNLIVPMTAHFVNNGFGLIMLYLYQNGKINLDVESTEALPWPALVAGTLLTVGITVYLKKFFQRNPANA